MKFVKIILYFVILLLILIGIFCFWIGAFTKVHVRETVIGGYIVVGTNYVGSYHSVAKSMNMVDSILRANGVDCKRGFGIYKDDPSIVVSEKCRSFVGNIIEIKDSSSIRKILETGLIVDTIPIKKSVVAFFPYKNSLSFIVGPLKVYPVLSDYLNTHKLTSSLSVEIYDIPSKQITYIFQYN